MDERGKDSFVIDSDQRIVEIGGSATALLGDRALRQPCYEVVRGVDAFGRPVCAPRCRAFKALHEGQIVARSSSFLVKEASPLSSFRCELTALPAIPGGALARLQRAGTESRATVYDLAAVATLATSLSPTSIHQGVSKTLDLVRETTGADAAEIFLAEPGGDSMVLSWQRGRFRRAFLEILRFNRGEGYPGLILADQQPIVTDCLAADHRFLRSRVKELGFGAYVGVPIRCSSGTVGSLGVAFRHANVDLRRVHNILSWVSAPLGTVLEAYVLRLQELARTTLKVTASDRGENLGETVRNALIHMVDVGGAQGGSLIPLGRKASPVLRPLTEGLAPRSLCPALARDPSSECPALRDRQGITIYGPRDQWPLPCRRNPRAGSVSYCIPLYADSQAVGLCQLYYHKIGTLPPTWNLAVLETIGGVAGQAIQEAQERLEGQRRAEAAVAGLLQRIPAEGRPSPLTPASLPGEPEPRVPYLDIRCFGPFELYRQGVLITSDSVHRRKALTLLKLLLTQNGRPLAKDTLIELLWPEGSPKVKAGQLYVLVHDLRQLLEPGAKGNWLFVRNDGDRYYFSSHESCHVDVRHFNSLVKLGRKAEAKGDTAAAMASYETATDLYGGDFLEDEPFAEWCWQERERLRETCMEVLQSMASVYGSSGEWGRSARCLRRILRIDPLREEIHRALMFSLWAGGRRDEALRQFDLCREMLRRDLEASPLPDTERLAERIRTEPAP